MGCAEILLGLLAQNASLSCDLFKRQMTLRNPYVAILVLRLTAALWGSIPELHRVYVGHVSKVERFFGHRYAFWLIMKNIQKNRSEEVENQPYTTILQFL